jgi:hypothetical protein
VQKIGRDKGLTFLLTADPRLEIFQRYFTKYVPRKVLLRRDGTIGLLASGYNELDGASTLKAAVSSELAQKAR